MTAAETPYVLTSLASAGDAKQLLDGYVRSYCLIVNRVRWVRDCSFGEDRHQLRSLVSPAQVLSTLRNLLMSLIRLAGSNQIISTMR